mmetsp:Transcript_22696/g.52015  ORF Transcript_22696/g.52015 Transcript_22696/m.52015 type:complete len:110 (+) Transcript_22696:2089-2418(+)
MVAFVFTIISPPKTLDMPLEKDGSGSFFTIFRKLFLGLLSEIDVDIRLETELCPAANSEAFINDRTCRNNKISNAPERNILLGTSSDIIQWNIILLALVTNRNLERDVG